LCAGSKQFSILDFTSDVDKFQDFVEDVRAFGGGGDCPEDVAGALRKANSLSWSLGTRVVSSGRLSSSWISIQ
jgi:hypothetical protein